jgi:hypothetical protein
MTKSSEAAAEKVPSLKKKVVPREIPKKLRQLVSPKSPIP